MTYEFTIVRTFAASPEEVFALWTEPAHFSRWFGTDAVTVPLDTLSLDVRVGGTWSATMLLPDGETTIDWVGEYLEVERPHRLVLTITDQPQFDARGTVTVTFEVIDDTTVMTMTQSGEGIEQAQTEQTVIGYNAFFDVMEQLL